MTYTDDYADQPDEFSEHPGHPGWAWDGTRWHCTRPPGPGGPCPPEPDRPINGPIVGVTDGRPAKPGMVGEFLRRDLVITLVQPTLTYQISALVLPPGDWNVWAWAEFDIVMRGALFHMDPGQVGFTGGMTGRAMLVSPGEFDSGHYINSEPAFAQLSVPTLVPFSMVLFDPVWNSGGMKVQFACAARRVR